MSEREVPGVNEPAATPQFEAAHAAGPIDLIGLVLGIALLVGWLLLVDTSLPSASSSHAESAPAAGTEEAESAAASGPYARPVQLRMGLSPQAHRLAGVMLLTIVWWLTEPIPIPATGVLAVALCVLLGAVPGDAAPVRTALAPFAEPSLFFLLGGMFIGRAMTRHGLDRRIAISILTTRWAARSPGTVLIAVGLTVAVLSMWISNTAATAMVFPVTIGMISVLAVNDPSGRFARGPYASMLLLMTAYASSIGGVATPIGTTTNVVAIGFFRQEQYFGAGVDFFRWMLVGVPLMLLTLAGLLIWMRLRAGSPGLRMGDLRNYLDQQRNELGPWNRGEWNTLFVFIIVVTLWVMPAFLSLGGASDRLGWFNRHFPEEIVALLAPVLLYLMPVDWRRRRFTLEPEDFSKVDWGTILLFGAGLSLGSLMFKTGLAASLGQASFNAIGTDDVWVLTAFAIAAGIILSEFTSNAATVATLFPVIWSLCTAAGVEVLPPIMGMVFGASFGSALPVSTPPNAIVYGSGLIPVRRMIGAGVGLDIISGLAIWIVLRAAWALGWSPFLSGNA